MASDVHVTTIESVAVFSVRMETVRYNNEEQVLPDSCPILDIGNDNPYEDGTSIGTARNLEVIEGTGYVRADVSVPSKYRNNKFVLFEPKAGKFEAWTTEPKG